MKVLTICALMTFALWQSNDVFSQMVISTSGQIISPPGQDNLDSGYARMQYNGTIQPPINVPMKITNVAGNKVTVDNNGVPITFIVTNINQIDTTCVNLPGSTPYLTILLLALTGFDYVGVTTCL